jgi:type I restriction enzyme S subunit
MEAVMLHDGWINCRLGDLFDNRKERGRAGLPTLSVTMKEGLVDRDDLDRKQDTALSPSEHLLVKPGDIAYNTMRMWQGAFGLSDREGMVSPAYVVLKPKDNVDPAFLAQLLRTPRMLHQLWAYSYGLTDDRLRLYFDDFAAIPVAIPRLEAQQKIASGIALWDRAINATEKLLSNSRLQRSAVVEKFTSGKKSCHGGPDQWTESTLGEVATVLVSNVDKKSQSDERQVLLCNYTDVYYNDRIASNMKFMEATATDAQIEKFTLHKGDVVITKDSESVDDIGVAAYVHDEVDGLVCGYHLAVIRPNLSEVNPVFLQAVFGLASSRAYLASNSNGVTRFGLPIGAIKEMPILIPSIDEQNRIAAMLSLCTDGINCLVQDLAALKLQKKELLSKLFSRKRRVSFLYANKEALA